MGNNQTIFLGILLSLFAFNSFADERFETHTGLCHFAYDANDDDNEVYFANCENTIDTNDAQDGQGRLAYGSSIITKKYDSYGETLKHENHVKLKGADADPTRYKDSQYTSAPNIPCVMVTSNYDAGNDDDNQTVYVTNDWDLQIMDANKHYPKNKYMAKATKFIKTKNDRITYKLSCRGGVKQ